MDKKQALWNEATRNYYQVFLQERIIDRLIIRWEHFDLIYKILIGLTTTGSAISGWMIWSEPEFRWLWLILTSVAPLLTVFYASASIDKELKKANRLLPNLTRLRGDYESIILEMEVGDYLFDSKNREYLKKLFNSYTSILTSHNAPQFPFVTTSFKAKVQTNLDTYLRSIGRIE
jgi:hypothetical protein